MSNNTVFDGSHRHGQPEELVFSTPMTLEELVIAIQDEAYLRSLAEQAASQGGLAASLLSSGAGTLRFWINCADGCMKVSMDSQRN